MDLKKNIKDIILDRVELTPWTENPRRLLVSPVQMSRDSGHGPVIIDEFFVIDNENGWF